MKFDLPQETEAADQRSWPRVHQTPGNNDLNPEETNQVLLMLLNALNLTVERSRDELGNRTLVLYEKP